MKSYEEYKNEAKTNRYLDMKCFVAGCNKPAEFEGGDDRFRCGMCEEHSGIKDSYDIYMKEALDKIRIEKEMEEKERKWRLKNAICNDKRL